MTVEKFPERGARAQKDEPGHIGVREASRHDYDALRSLFERFYRDEGFSEAAVERIEHSLREVIEREDTAAFVALIGGEVVGGAAMSLSYGLETGLHAELQDLYVEPEARGRGAASALVDACIMWAERQGCEDVEIVLTPKAQENEALLDWYARRGFGATGRIVWQRDLRTHE